MKIKDVRKQLDELDELNEKNEWKISVSIFLKKQDILVLSSLAGKESIAEYTTNIIKNHISKCSKILKEK